jgi:hypothetical protein
METASQNVHKLLFYFIWTSSMISVNASFQISISNYTNITFNIDNSQLSPVIFDVMVY